jgi:signal transduction histidine kinase
MEYQSVMGTNRRRLFGSAREDDYVVAQPDSTMGKNSRLAARQLSARLLRLQDQERRKFARELHDSAGQLVASLMMNTDQLSKVQELNTEQKRLIADNVAILQNLSKELRTISHLLHPPLLDEIGLSSALQWYVDGFAKRSGIPTTLELDANFGRLDSDAEIAIFRIVQECLTNVHRHSGSAKAVVRLNRSGREVRLEVQDEGKGIPAEKQMSVLGAGHVGVGFRGMRERVRQLGGKLELRSEAPGTTVIATLPVGKTKNLAA